MIEHKHNPQMGVFAVCASEPPDRGMASFMCQNPQTGVVIKMTTIGLCGGPSKNDFEPLDRGRFFFMYTKPPHNPTQVTSRGGSI